MLKINKIPRILWIVLATAAFILVGYFLYFRVYQDVREQRVAVSYSRVLGQIGNGVREINDIFIKNEANYLEKVVLAADSLIESGETGPILTEEKLKRTNPALKKLNHNIRVSFHPTDEDEPARDTVPDHGDIEHVYPVTKPAGSVIFSYSLGSILNLPADQRIFEGLIVIRKGDVAYNSLSSDIELTKKAKAGNPTDTGPESSIRLPGATDEENFHLFSGSRQEISINNIHYQLFLKPLKMNGEIWYLGGLVKESDYRASIRTLDPWLVILLSVILIVIFLGLPILKLKLMSRFEHLYTSTIVTSALSVMLGSAFLTLLLYYIFHQPSISANTDGKLKMLADTVESAFYEELHAMTDQLYFYDQHFDEIFPDLRENSFINNVLNPASYPDKLENLGSRKKWSPPDTSRWKPEHYPWFDYVFWTNGEGDQVAEIFTFDNDSSNLINVGTRKYVREHDAWSVPYADEPGKSRRFRLESIYSYTSGVAKAAVGTPSEQHPVHLKNSNDTVTKVAAMTARMYSITNTILPPGYLFAIIDKEGTVWFHHEPSRNMQENIFGETDQNRYLRAAMYSNTSKALNTQYYNRPHRAFIRPLKNMPLYLLVMSDKQIRQMEQVQVITVTLAFFGILFTLLFLVIAMLLIIERRGKKKKSINLIYLLSRPMSKHEHQYRQLIIDNTVIFLLTVIFTVMAKPLDAIAIVFPGVLITALHNYSVFNGKYAPKNFIRFLLPGYILPLLALNLLYLVLTKFQLASPLFFFYQLSIIAMISLRAGIFRLSPSGDLHRSYLVYLVSLMAVMSVLPILVFSSRIARYEDQIRVRHDQLQLLKSLEKRNEQIKTYYTGIDDPGDLYELKRREKGVYTAFNDHTTVDMAGGPLYPQPGSHPLLDSLMCFLRPFYTDEDVESKYLVFNRSCHGLYNWHSKKDTVQLTYRDPYSSKNTDLIVIRSVLPDEIPLLPYSGKPFSTVAVNLIFLLAFLVVIYLLYLIVKYGVSILFPLKVSRVTREQDFEDLLIRSARSGKVVPVIKTSSRQPSLHLARILSDDFSVQYHDAVMKVPAPGKPTRPAKDDKPALMVIDNAEYLFTGGGQGQKLLPEIRPGARRHFVLVFSSSQQTIHNLIVEHVADPAVQRGLAAAVGAAPFLTLPVFTGDTEREHPDCTGDVCDELRSCDYLAQRLEMFLPEFGKVSGEHSNVEYERFMDRIILVASGYYQDLLNSCSDEERYILYDLARDLIINPKNMPVILGLIRKGLLVNKLDGIEIMNESFRRYLLRALDDEELRELEHRLFRPGAWNSYRAMLVMVIIGLFVFLWLANEAFLENLNRLFVILGAAIATVTGVLGFLSKSRKSAGER